MPGGPPQLSITETTLDYGALPAGDARRKLVGNISAVVQAGSALWLASDEGRSIERLTWRGNRFTDAVSHELDQYFALPDGRPEIDVESLAVDNHALWIAGSHSR